MATIYDVAKEAHVSLGYQPNLLARSLATQRTRTLGMVVPTWSRA